MKSLAFLALVGAAAFACAASVFAGPIGDDESGASASESFTPQPPLGQDVADYINSLPPDAEDRSNGNVLGYDNDASVYMTKSTRDHKSWSDIVGATTSAYDQYWLNHTSPPPRPLFKPLFFNAPTGNLGESDAAGESYMFSVTARSIKFATLVPEPTPLLLLLGAGVAVLALARRRSKSS